MTTHYRGRIAPTPTGYLHLGHARTFWIAQQRAQAAKGTLILRNEDLDLQRCKPEFVDAMIEDLRWIGLDWQEGPDIGGQFAPYTQSERLPLYKTALLQLIEAGFAYPCSCSRKDLARIAAPHADEEDEPVYDNHCRTDKPDLFQPGINYRFRTPDDEAIDFTDLHLGEQRFISGKDFGDFLIWRKDGLPSYQLACVVDDAAMEITEVVRGRDLLKSTARQILLQRTLGHQTPDYFHTNLLLDENGQRLAKRHDSLSLRTLRERGIQPEELVAGL